MAKLIVQYGLMACLSLGLAVSCSSDRGDDGTSRREAGNSPSNEELAKRRQRQDPELELLTILGDVANKPRDLPGRWRPARDGGAIEQPSPEEVDKLSELQTLPYLQGYKEAPDQLNVIRHDAERAWPGINVYTSGHAPEAIMMDMQGRVLHKWQIDIRDVWPDVPFTIHSTFWRRVHWYPNGDILAIFEGIGIVKLNRYSRVLWKYRGGCHHEAVVMENGDIYVLTRFAEKNRRLNPDKPVLIDAVTVLSSDGQVKNEYNLLECFERSEFRHLMVGMKREGDIFHTNSLYVFDGGHADVSPLFAKGNVLISMLKLDAVAIVDLEAQTVVWGHSGKQNGMWEKQHDPTLLANGNMLLFDNRGNDGKSKVLEFDPQTLEVVWRYGGETGDELYSKTCGTTVRLPNGNTLITESDNGRALEVTPNKKIVWEFLNPNRAGEDNTLIATLFDLTRFERTYFPWLQAE